MLGFLVGWLEKYPEYSKTEFYITGESFAGKERSLRGTLI
jgi:carboxypeptidase C (cathepsin A)